MTCTPIGYVSRDSRTFMSPHRVQHTPSGHRMPSKASRHSSSHENLSIREIRSMTQNPPRKRKLPKDALQKNSHDLMECIFGKRIMKEVDKLIEENSKGNIFMTSPLQEIFDRISHGVPKILIFQQQTPEPSPQEIAARFLGVSCPEDQDSSPDQQRHTGK